MEIIKKNLVSIICGVIALLAFIAIFWPLGGYFSELQTTADSRKSIDSTLRGLIDKQRRLPIVDPVSVEQKTMAQFPSTEIIEKGREVTKQVADISNKMLDIAVELNRHELLVPNVLPSPNNIAQFQFRDAYRKAMEQTIPTDILNSGTPPMDVDIQEAVKKLWDTDYAPRIIIVNGQPANEAQLKAQFQAASDNLPRRMREEIAEKHKIYMRSDITVQDAALTVNRAVLGQGAPDTLEIWWAQQGLWIQTDVAKAIAATNAGAKNVTDAPVKHLLKLSVPQDYVREQKQAQGGGEAGAPAAVNDGSTPLPKVTTVSPTGRVSNSLYDVVHFTLSVRVDAEKIPQFLTELGRNRLITVFDMQVGSVNSLDFEPAGYFYGPKPIVQLNMKCEALFMRKWTEPLMPERLKRLMGLLPPLVPGQPG